MNLNNICAMHGFWIGICTKHGRRIDINVPNRLWIVVCAVQGLWLYIGTKRCLWIDICIMNRLRNNVCAVEGHWIGIHALRDLIDVCALSGL